MLQIGKRLINSEFLYANQRSVHIILKHVYVNNNYKMFLFLIILPKFTVLRNFP